MSRRAWEALERAIAAARAPTRPRAIGGILERALGAETVVDWQQWQIQKEKRLLDAEAS
jgi:hypothetical protein